MNKGFLFRTLALCAILVLPYWATVSTSGQDDSTKRKGINDKWEYLVMSGASSTNFQPTGNPNMRKESGGFGRESFVLEQHLDQLGTKGWELVSVSGTVTDPVYYFKRRR
jgi:hypothetical protein